MNLQALSIAVAATIGIVEVLKKTGLSSRWAPLLSLAIGIGMTMLFTQTVNLGVIGIGVLTGLSASGAYSGTQALVGGGKKE